MKDIMNLTYYLFNRWTYAESLKVFGENLGSHIYDKWTDAKDSLRFFSSLDRDCRQKILDRANEIY